MNDYNLKEASDLRSNRYVPNANPPRSVFNLSYEHKTTADLFQLIPIMYKEVVPGDIFKLGNRIKVRTQPLVTPLFHDIDIYVHYFYCPNRILDPDWDNAITGGANGQSVMSLPLYLMANLDNYQEANASGTLLDYFGLPFVAPSGGATDPWLPLSYPWRAYLKIYNYYYRNQNIEDEVQFDLIDTAQQNKIRTRCVQKDYFSCALTSWQRGPVQYIPLKNIGGDVVTSVTFPAFNATGATNLVGTATGNAPASALTKAVLENNVLAVQNLGFRMDDFFLANAVTMWMLRNNRAGVRPNEFIQAHFNVNPGDERLQQPEYIGGSRTPLIISEVLNTTDDGTHPQGQMSGHGIAVDDSYCGTYRCTDFGWIMGIMSIMPKIDYQGGIDKSLLRRTRTDFYFPEFAHLADQPIKKGELFYTANSGDDDAIFGYIGHYDEMRSSRNMVTGKMRSNISDSLDTWHLARDFASVPALNAAFLQPDAITGGVDNPWRRCLSVPTQPMFLVTIGNMIKAARPLPFVADPQL